MADGKWSVRAGGGWVGLEALGCFLAGLILGQHLRAPWWLLFMGIAGVLGLCLACGRALAGPSRWRLLTLGILLLAGWARAPEPPLAGLGEDANPRQGEVWGIRGEVLSVSPSPYGGGSFILRSGWISLGRTTRRARVKVEVRFRISPPPIAGGESVLVRGEVERFRGPRNPGEIGENEYQRRRGVALRIRVKGEGNLIVLDKASRSWTERCPAAVRGWYRASAERYLTGSTRGLYLAMVLGMREEITPQLAENMTRAGTAHLLAVSGLHVGFVALLLLRSGRLIGLGPSPAASVVIPFLGFYVVLTGGRPSVLRASLVAVSLLGGLVLGRRRNPLNALAVSALAILMARPTAWAGAGFQLSYAAATSLVLAMPLLTGPHTPGSGARPGPLMTLSRRLGQGLAVTTIAQLGVLPILLGSYGRISLLAPLTNLAAVPLAGLAVPVGLVLPLVDRVSPLWGEAWGTSLWLLLRSLECLSGRAASLQGPGLILGRPPIAAIVLYYAGLLACRWGGRSRRTAGVLLLATSCLFLGAKRLQPQSATCPSPWFRAVFLDVGQGDACLLRTAAGTAVLVDGGPRTGTWDAGERVILPHLRREGVNELDLVILTHPHGDHLGGLAAVVEGIPVRFLVDGGQVTDSAAYMRLLRLARSRGVGYVQPVPGEVLWDDGIMRLEVLGGPPRSPGESWRNAGDDLNEGSLVVRALAEGIEVLLLADLGRKGQDSLARPCVAPWSLVKVAHHGSRTGVSPSLVAGCHPRWAVVTAARRNPWGFPHPETMAAYRVLGTRIWTTGVDGALTVEARGGRVSLRGPEGEMIDAHRIPPPRCRLHVGGARGPNAVVTSPPR